MKPLGCLFMLTATFALVSPVGAASKHGYFILAQASPPEVCIEIYQPVCGTDQNGKRVTYSNACFARIAKATNETPGECPR